MVITTKQITMDDIERATCSIERLDLMLLMSKQSQARFNQSCDRLDQLAKDRMATYHAVADRTQQALDQLV